MSDDLLTIPEELLALRSENEKLREAMKGATIIATTSGLLLEANEAEIKRLRKQLVRAREALKPFSEMYGAMYVSGHCGGASPEDWPDRWRVTVEGYDGKHLHSTQNFGESLKVSDFHRARTTLSDEQRCEE